MTTPVATYGSSPIRRRRTKADMYVIRDAMREVLEEIQPATVRQVFYALVSRGVVAKTEAEYKTTVCRLLSDMRREEVIPYGWIADSTRWMRKPKTYTGLVDMLSTTRATYRRDLWSTQAAYVEVWLEKDALAGVLVPETNEWDVPLMVTRGYPSLSFVHEAALALRQQECPAFIYYLGDPIPVGSISHGLSRRSSGAGPPTSISPSSCWQSRSTRSSNSASNATHEEDR